VQLGLGRGAIPGEGFGELARSSAELLDEIARSGKAVEGGGRRIAVTFVRGYPVAQVFSPPGAPFVCFEPMTAPANALLSGAGLRRVHSGATFAAVFRIAIGPEEEPCPR
jgi:galactose mutarotase-like enzyme